MDTPHILVKKFTFEAKRPPYETRTYHFEATTMNQYSVIIPVYNEEIIISRLLSKLVSHHSSKMEIIVVCNGCTDNSAEVVKKFLPHVKLVEIQQASKPLALQQGDDLATGWPRFYIDADVLLDRSALTKMAGKLKSKGLFAISPAAISKVGNSSWFVKAFYSVWTSMPYYKDGMIGCGIYGLSKHGRNRFKKWPNLIADDGYVRALFSNSERVVCHDTSVTVQAPRSVTELLKIKTRSRLGRLQLSIQYPNLIQAEKKEKNYLRIINMFVQKPGLIFCFPIYLFVYVISRLRAKKQLKTISEYTWERDNSSRQPEQ